MFDGEICLLDKDGNEDFQGVMKELRRKDHQIENPTFMIFDMIHKTEFDKGKSTDILSERLQTLILLQPVEETVLLLIHR